MLIEVSTPVSSNEVDKLGADITTTLTRMGGEVLICVNMVHADLLPPHVIDGYVNIMRKDNPHLVRSAYWVATDGLLGQQIGRMLSQAGNLLRRQFRHRSELEAWLSELMTVEERSALKAYLDKFG